MSVHDLEKYKNAKVLIADLEGLIVFLTQVEGFLGGYLKYMPIFKLYNNVRDNRTVLEIHLNNQRKILETKGETNSR